MLPVGRDPLPAAGDSRQRADKVAHLGSEVCMGTGVQEYRSTGVLVYSYTVVQLYRCIAVSLCRCIPVLVCKCTVEEVYQFSDVKIDRYTCVQP